jgi:hypothetical protein
MLLTTPNGWWKFSKVVGIAVAIAVFGFVPGFGIPGAIVLFLSDWAIQLLGGRLWGYEGLSMYSYEPVWEAAIYTTFLWPPCIVVGYVVGFHSLRQRPKRIQWLSFVAILSGWGIGITLWMAHVLSGEFSGAGG